MWRSLALRVCYYMGVYNEAALELKIHKEILNDIKDVEWRKCKKIGCNAFGCYNMGMEVYTNCEMLYSDNGEWNDDTNWYCKEHFPEDLPMSLI